jgi:hypothetical protein
VHYKLDEIRFLTPGTGAHALDQGRQNGDRGNVGDPAGRPYRVVQGLAGRYVPVRSPWLCLFGQLLMQHFNQKLGIAEPG